MLFREKIIQKNEDSIKIFAMGFRIHNFILYKSTTNKSSRSAEGLRARMYAPAHGQVNNSSKANFPIKTTNVDCEQDYLSCVEFIDKLSRTLYSSNQVNDRQRSSSLAQWV